MALINCDECGANVSDRATACPHCGNPIHAGDSVAPASVLPGTSTGARTSPNKATAPPNRKLGAGLAVFLIAVMAFMAYESQSTGSSTTSARDASSAATVAPPAPSPAESPKNEQRADTTPAEPVIEISATQLYAEYKANEVLADTKYKGRWLYVSGMVNEIGKDFVDNPFVNLFGESEYAVVRANFANSAIQKLATLQKGDRVSLTCLGKGRLIGDAILDCTSESVPAAPQHANTGANSAPAESAAPGPGKEAATSSATLGTTEVGSYLTSFDCSKAHSPTETLICGDEELAALDRDLAVLHAQAKVATPDKKAFAVGTTQNWNWRERNCRDKVCLVTWYADQKQRFMDILTVAPKETIDDAQPQAVGRAASDVL